VNGLSSASLKNTLFGKTIDFETASRAMAAWTWTKIDTIGAHRCATCHFGR
jgi:hypothetical protein